MDGLELGLISHVACCRLMSHQDKAICDAAKSRYNHNYGFRFCLHNLFYQADALSRTHRSATEFQYFH